MTAAEALAVDRLVAGYGKSPGQVLDMGIVPVPQDHSLFGEMTVRENIELGGHPGTAR